MIRMAQKNVALTAGKTATLPQNVEDAIINTRLDTPEYRAKLQALTPARQMNAALADLAEARRIESFFVDTIEVMDGRRPVQDEAVESLAASMAAIGLRTPISVRYYPERPEHLPGDPGDVLVLMTGGHRLAAAKRLGWKKIECFVYHDGDDLDAQLWEIAENLHRASLTKEQRDEQIRRYAELLAERDEVSTQFASKPQGGRPQGIASKIAEATGVSKDTVRRALSPDRVKKERARAEHKAQQAERDRQREEHAAKLPAFVAEREKAKAQAIAARKITESQTDPVSDGLSPEDRIAELEEAVTVLEKENAELRAENKLYREMKVQFEQGGYDKVIADKEEEIRVLQTRLYSESADKVSWMKSAKYWQAEAKKLGWSDDVVIDIQTGEVVDG